MTAGKARVRYAAAFLLLGIGMAVSLIVSVLIGTTKIPFAEAVKAVFGGGGGYSDILWKIRIPRALTALLLGGLLALSGYLLQTFFHNPIAGPFVLGVSSGAKLTVALTMIFAFKFVNSISSAAMIGAAFVGSMISLGFVLLASRKMPRMSMLVVCGIMIGYICSAITDFAVTFARDSDIVNLHDWSKGTFSGRSMDDVLVIVIIAAVAVFGTALISKPMGAYMLGENYAQSVGVNLKALKVALVVLSGLMSACVAAFAGPVSFVGIAVPQLARMMLGTSKPSVMIPTCFMAGSIFCMVCDIISRMVLSPTELSISTVTAVFGAPVVIAVMIRRRRGEL